MEARDPLRLELSSEDFSSVVVKVGFGLVLTLAPRTQSLFSQDFLNGYVFYVTCPTCGDYFGPRSVYDPQAGTYSCECGKGTYQLAGDPMPWWASKTGIEKIAGLVAVRDQRGAGWVKSPAPAADIVKALYDFDNFTALEAFVAPHYDPFEGRLATVELGEKLEEVFVAWKTASRRRKPELRQAEYEKFLAELSA